MIRDAIGNATTKEREVNHIRGEWHSIRVRPYMSGGNKVAGAVLTIANIDNQKRQAADQRESIDELRRQSELLHLAHDSIIVRDVNSVILFWNRGAEETYGYTAGEACGNVSHQFLKTEFPEPFDQMHEKLFAGGSWEGELIHRTRAGKRITVASRQVLQHDQNGRVIGILEINNDITLRKEAEESLRNLSARLLQLQDDERRRIARELHDSTGQSLAALVIHLSAVSASLPEADETTAASAPRGHSDLTDRFGRNSDAFVSSASSDARLCRAKIGAGVVHRGIYAEKQGESRLEGVAGAEPAFRNRGKDTISDCAGKLD